MTALNLVEKEKILYKINNDTFYNTITENSILNNLQGYLSKEFNTNYEILYKAGASRIKNDYLLACGENLYILDYKGSLRYKLNIKQLSNYIKIADINTISNPVEVRPYTYGFSIIMDDWEHKLNNMYVIVHYDIDEHNWTVEETYKLIGKNLVTEDHGNIYYDKGHILLSGRQVDFSSGSPVFTTNDILQELKDGKVIWQWESKDYLEYIENINIRREFDNNLFHINGIAEYQDGYIVSARDIGILYINKITNNIDWMIGVKENTLNMSDIPRLQHNVTFIDKDRFLVFNNNWPENSIPIREMLNNLNESTELLDSRFKCQILEYNLKTKSSKCYQTSVQATPRCGNVIPVDEGIFDINYGQCITWDNATQQYIKYGLVEEYDFNTNQVLFRLIFRTSTFCVGRGLLKDN